MDRDHYHVVIGAMILLATHLMKRPPVVAFAAAFLAGVAMEVLDARDDVYGLGVWRWRESVSDILLTIAAPLLVLAVTWMRRQRL